MILQRLVFSITKSTFLSVVYLVTITKRSMGREVNTLAKSTDSDLASFICAVSDKDSNPRGQKQRQRPFRRRRDPLSATTTRTSKIKTPEQENEKMPRGKDTGAATTAEVADSPNIIIRIETLCGSYNHPRL